MAKRKQQYLEIDELIEKLEDGEELDATTIGLSLAYAWKGLIEALENTKDEE